MTVSWAAPLSAQGGGSGSGGSVYSFVWRPDGGIDEGYIFETLATLIAAMAAVQGPKLLYCDDQDNDCELNTAWDMTGITLAGGAVQIAAVVTNLLAIRATAVEWATGGRIALDDQTLVIADGATLVCSSALGLIRLEDDSVIRLETGAQLLSSGTPVVKCNDFGLTISGGENTVCAANAIYVDASSTATFTYASATASVSSTVYLGTNSLTIAGLATSVKQTWTAAQNVAAVALTWGANIAVNAALSNTFKVTAAGATAQIDNPTNMVDGQTFVFRLLQNAGSQAFTFGTAFEWDLGGTPNFATSGAGVLDIVTGTSDGTKIYCSVARGYTP